MSTNTCRCGRPKSAAAKVCQGCWLDDYAAQHGTDSGYYAELRAGLTTCPACRAAHAAATADRQKRNPRKRPPRAGTKTSRACRDCGTKISHSAEVCRRCAGARRRDAAAEPVTQWVQHGGVWRAVA